MEVLRQIWIQQYYGPEDLPRWRQDRDVPPAAQLIHSPYDLEARYSIKRGMAWVGYKAHLTETCDDETPHVITHVETTPATTPEDNMLETIHPALAAKGLLPHAHLVDCGYTDAVTLVTSTQEYGVTVIGPVAAAPSWQAREGTGFDNAAFTINWEAHTATCPRGKQSRKWQPDQDVTGQDVIRSALPRKTAKPVWRGRPVPVRKPNPARSPSGPRFIMKPSRQRATTRRQRSSRSTMPTERVLKGPRRRRCGRSTCADHAILASRRRICSIS